jgi:hypothetical protein
MKIRLKLTFTLCMALAAAAALAQSTRTQMQVSSGSGISVNSVNGQTVVTWNGEQVFTGPTKGLVSARTSSVNGAQYAAAFDGDAVIWENVPGAAQQASPGTGGQMGVDRQKLMESLKKMIEERKKFAEQQQQMFNGQMNGGGFSFGSAISGNGVSVKSRNGETVVMYQGKEISIGPTKGKVFAKSKSVNSASYAVVYDGDQVVWENVPGAAEQFK